MDDTLPRMDAARIEKLLRRQEDKKGGLDRFTADGGRRSVAAPAWRAADIEKKGGQHDQQTWQEA